MKESFNTYFEDLLAAIEQNRNVSLKECLKTDLYISSVSESIKSKCIFVGQFLRYAKMEAVII